MHHRLGLILHAITKKNSHRNNFYIRNIFACYFNYYCIEFDNNSPEVS